MHKEAQQAAGGLTSLRATNEEGAHPQLSSGMFAFIHIELVHSASFTFHSESALGGDASTDSTAKADLVISAPNNSIPSQHGMDEGTLYYSLDHIFAGTIPSVFVDQTEYAGYGLKIVHADLEFNSIGNGGKCALEIERRLRFHQSIEIDQVGQRFEMVERLVKMVVDLSFLEVILPRSSNMDKIHIGGEDSFEDMSMTMVLAIFFGGFLVDDEAFEVVLEKIRGGFEADLLRFLGGVRMVIASFNL
uniref:Uncharacterized protein n=1 Tax=Tanacetum cinerariifolium TaxID=118510 RepID=A0A6L2M2Q8_TANCI|nr:hypothetical protein [Tanacetum cinerariifolium]